MMPSAKIIICILGTLGVWGQAQRVSSETPPKSKTIVIAASAVLDGKGRARHSHRDRGLKDCRD
jgi:hypothetical protein